MLRDSWRFSTKPQRIRGWGKNPFHIKKSYEPTRNVGGGSSRKAHSSGKAHGAPCVTQPIHQRHHRPTLTSRPRVTCFQVQLLRPLCPLHLLQQFHAHLEILVLRAYFNSYRQKSRSASPPWGLGTLSAFSKTELMDLWPLNRKLWRAFFFGGNSCYSNLLHHQATNKHRKYVRM